MRKAQFNAIINIAGFAAFAVLSVTGLVELLFLPPGTGGRGSGRGPSAAVLGMGRHDWGDIHNVAGIIFLAIIGLHLVLHWRWVKCLPRLLASARPVQPVPEPCAREERWPAACEPASDRNSAD